MTDMASPPTAPVTITSNAGNVKAVMSYDIQSLLTALDPLVMGTVLNLGTWAIASVVEHNGVYTAVLTKK